MDALPGTSRIDSQLGVRERQGGRRGNADAFRRALQQEAEAGRDEAAAPEPEAPMRPTLQPKAPDSRKEEHARHIDVYA